MNSRRYPNFEKYWSKFMFSFFDYMPMKKKDATREEWNVRKLIWAFKDGKQSAQIATIVAKKLVQLYGDNLNNIVFACIPASSAEKNEKRYKEFSQIVCKQSGAINGYEHIEVEGERLAIHENKAQKFINSVEVVNFDKDFFRGKKVIVFDDILTRGFSFAKFSRSLENLGAEILGGLFLGKTALV